MLNVEVSMTIQVTKFYYSIIQLRGQDSVVGIATHYRLDGLGFALSYAHLFRLALGPTSLQRVLSSLLSIKQMEHGIYHPPHLALRLRMS
jgi:hypothetical protein